MNTLELQHQKVSSDLLSLKKKHEILINSPIMNIQTPIFETNMITEYSNIIHRIRNECSILRSQLNTTTNGLSTVRRSSLLLQKELQTQIDTMKSEQMTIQNELKDMHDKCLRIEKENKQLIQENVSCVDYAV